jgi:transcriptional regulator GlxA family with amidase domain
MHSIRVAVLAFDGVSLFHLSVPGVVLGTAQSAPGEPEYEVSYFAEKPGMVSSDQGIDLAVAHGLELMEPSDVIVIPAWGDQSVTASVPLVKALQLADTQGKLIVGLCLGAFVLGEMPDCSMGRKQRLTGPFETNLHGVFPRSVSGPKCSMSPMAMS